jgi:hypothetical protein
MKTLFALFIATASALATTQYPLTGGSGEDIIPLPPENNVVAVHPATQSQINTAYQNASNYMANQGGYQPAQTGGYIQQGGYQSSPQGYIGQQLSNYSQPNNNYQIIPKNNSTIGTAAGVATSGLGAYQSAQNGDYMGAAQQGLQAIEQLSGSDIGQKLTGSFGNLMNGTLGQAGGSAAGGATGAASGAGGSSGGAGGGGAGAAVMDIGSIIQGVLQNMQLSNQTQIQSNQLGTLGHVLNVNTQDLAVTKAINGNIGSTQDFSKNQAGLVSSLGNSVNNIFGGGGSGGSSAGGSGGTSSGMAGVMQAGSQVGGFLNNSAGNLWDLFSGAQRAMSVAGNFKNDPIGSARDILSMLFGGNPSNRLTQMSSEEMLQAGIDVPGALAASYNSQILADAKNAVAANQSRTQRIQALSQAAQSSRSLNETAAVQTQVGIEQLRNQNEQIGQQATGVSASAANAERAAQLEMERRRLNNAQRLND